jgi:hypothetical protein
MDEQLVAIPHEQTWTFVWNSAKKNEKMIMYIVEIMLFE